MKIFKSYNSTAELAAVLSTKEPFKCWYLKGIDWTNESQQTRFVGVTKETADELLCKGDPERALSIRAQGEILCEANEAGRARIETAVVGCVPCIPNYLRGVPNNMLRLQRQHNETPVIDWYINTAIYDGIDTAEVAKKAAIIANVIAATEQSGVRVNLYAVCAAEKNGDEYGISVKLKEADAPLNLLNVAYCICNRAFCRSTFLRWIERHVNKYIRNYGRPIRRDGVKKHYNGLISDILDMINRNVNVETLTKEVNDYIKKVQEK